MASINSKFEETQKFTQTWVWVLLVLVFLSPFIINAGSVMKNGFQGTFSKGIFAHIVTIGLVIVLFLIMKLKTKMNQKTLSIWYVPLVKKEIDWKDVEQVRIVTYKFSETLGWGIRLWTKYGTVYSIKGNKGLFITLKNGSKYLIGTQKSAELENFIKHLNHPIFNEIKHHHE